MAFTSRLSDIDPAKRAYRRARLQAVLGLLVLTIGANLLTLSSWRLLALALLVAAVGGALFLRGFLFSRHPDGVLFRKRQEIVLAVASTLFFAVLVSVVGVLVRRPANARFANSNDRYDADLGWTGNTDATTIGQRRMPIDATKQHVLFVGDSVLYGHGLPADESTFAHILNSEYFASYQALNGAVSGYSIDQYYITLQHELTRLQPKLVVVGVFAGNDFQLTARDYGWGHSKPFFDIRDGKLVRLSGDLTRDNCIDRLAQSLLFGFLWSYRDFAESALQLFCQTRELDEVAEEAVQRRLFAEMVALATTHGSRILFLLLPDLNDFPNVGDDFYLRYYSRYRDLKGIIEEGGYDLMENLLPLARERVDPHELYLDTAHLNARGHRIMAKALAQELRQRYGIEG